LKTNKPLIKRVYALQRLRSHKTFSGTTIISLFLGWSVVLYPYQAFSVKNTFESINFLVGRDDSVIISDPQGKIIFEKNSDKKLIPASSLKVLTALVALNSLKDDFRFSTDFYLDDMSNLKIKGYGDPLLVSENLKYIGEILSQRIFAIHHVVLDDSYFQSPIIVPGVSARSLEPYDAPNGALCVNFNTVDFVCRNGKCFSGEPQTPLLPFIHPLIENSGMTTGRIPLSNSDDQAAFYAGYMIVFFLQSSGINITGELRLGKTDENKDRLILHYVSEFNLREVVSKLLAHSNNFIANQLMIAMGAEICGPPGSLEKGVDLIKTYAESVLGIRDISIVEGSGISKKT
jgi:serine-type D-Ala-D-Ala carboxypeptidase/endopeptidase (penicillin-binding protein 4)